MPRRHLSRCLESICGQEYKDLELIVINDGSKDKSLPVCEEFRKKDSRILLVDKANSGVSDHPEPRPEACRRQVRPVRGQR